MFFHLGAFSYSKTYNSKIVGKMKEINRGLCKFKSKTQHQLQKDAMLPRTGLLSLFRRCGFGSLVGAPDSLQLSAVL